MALKALLDTLDGAPDNVKSLYKPVGEGANAGKFVLDVETVGGFTLDDTSGLTSALGVARTELESAKSAAKGYEGLKLKPSEISAKLKRLGELEAFNPESEADKLAQSKLQGLQDGLTSEFNSKLGEKDTELSGLRGQVQTLLVENAATTAVQKHGGVPELLLPVIRGRTRTKQVDGKITVEVLDANGTIAFESIGNEVKPMSIDGLVAKLKADPVYGMAFKASGQSGSGAPRGNAGGGGNGASKTFTQKEWQLAVSEAKDGNERRSLMQKLASGEYSVNG